MKTIRISICAMMLLVGVSCVKEEQEITPPVMDNTDVPSFVALGSQVDGSAVSKVSLKDSTTSIQWAVGDLVAVADGSGDIYKFASEGNGTSAIFRYQSESEEECMFDKAADKYLMAYPWTVSVNADLAKNTVTSSLPAVQNAVKGNFDPASAVAVAKGDCIDSAFVFRCAVSMLKVEIPDTLGGKIAELAVRGNDGEDLAGDLVISCAEARPVTALGSRTYSEVRLISETGILEPGTYYIAIAPVAVSKGITVVAVSSDNYTEFKISTARKPKTFEPGYIYNLGTLNGEKIKFPTGLGRLPYMFSLYAEYGTGDTPEYVRKEVVTAKTELKLIDEGTRAELTVKSTGNMCDYWSNKWYGHDRLLGKFFTTKESADSLHKESYFMLRVPLKMSLPAAFRVSFGHFAEPAQDIIKDWKIQYSKNGETWYDGARYEYRKILKYYSVEITPEVPFNAGDLLCLRWIPVGNANWAGGTTTGLDAEAGIASGVVITDVVSPDSDAYGNVYAEDFDRISGGVDYRLDGQANGIEKLGLLGEVFGDKIDDWTDEQKNGLSGSFVAERPGYVQIGLATYNDDNRNGAGTNNVGSLITPALTKASGTISLSFKAMCYRSPFKDREKMSTTAQEDVTDIVVNIKGAGSFDPISSVKSKTLSGISTTKFDTKTLTVFLSDASTQIEFTSTPAKGKFTRWFIDDISVSK